MTMVRAAAWFNRLARFGLHLPLFVVHDVGLLFTMPRGATLTVGPDERLLALLGLPPEARALLGQYESLLNTIAQSEVVEKAASWRLRDDLVAVLLVKVL